VFFLLGQRKLDWAKSLRSVVLSIINKTLQLVAKSLLIGVMMSCLPLLIRNMCARLAHCSFLVVLAEGIFVLVERVEDPNHFQRASRIVLYPAFKYPVAKGSE
jgi:hypothetical protein